MTSVLQYRDPSLSRSFSMSTPSYHSPHMSSVKKTPPYDGSSGSDTKKQHTPGAKRRPSRAGTRSVSTLTAAQLERKRANDREAQRAIRQRTKDHIESLERQIRDLTAQQDTNSSSKLLELMRRNEELEQENAMLRTRLAQTVPTVATYGVPENGGNVMGAPETSGLISATGGAPSPSDRIQMLSQPRRSSTGARSVPSVPELSTPVSQPQHWQHQHPGYPPNVSSPAIETPPPLGGDVSGPPDGVRWSPHPSGHAQHHPVSMPMQDTSMHSADSSMSYPSPYGMESHPRSMSYPLEGAQLVTSQPMQMTGYGTPTSNPSPHPSDYQRHMSVPMGGHPPPPHATHSHPQQQGPSPYSAFPQPQHQHQHQAFAPSSHPQDMQMMAQSPHTQAPMMGEQGHMMYHVPHMKVEQH